MASVHLASLHLHEPCVCVSVWGWLFSLLVVLSSTCYVAVLLECCSVGDMILVVVWVVPVSPPRSSVVAKYHEAAVFLGFKVDVVASVGLVFIAHAFPVAVAVVFAIVLFVQHFRHRCLFLLVRRLL